MLIWSINENLIDDATLSEGINNISDNKAIEIKEADGAKDIGMQCYHWNPSFCDILTKGWEYDLWYDGNIQYFINNPNEDEVVLNDNIGMGAANNIGLIKCKTKYAYVINPDVRFKNNSIQKFL